MNGAIRWLAGAALAAGCAMAATAATATTAKPPAGSALSAATLATPLAPARLSAAEVIDKNVAARGGLEAWRKVETLVWIGHVEGAQAAARPMPFALEMKRPNLTHFEITAASDKFTRIFDGAHGWKLRPSRGGAQELHDFSPEEVKYAQEEFVIDGPLIDHRAKGVAVTLEGVDELEGRKAYRLTLKLPFGAIRRLWIDAETFLDTRYDRPSASPNHPGATSSVYYRNYAAVDGLQIPMLIEHGSAPSLEVQKAPDKLVIDRVLVNPALQDRTFAKPNAPRQRRATVNIGSQAPPQQLGPVVPSQ